MGYVKPPGERLWRSDVLRPFPEDVADVQGPLSACERRVGFATCVAVHREVISATFAPAPVQVFRKGQFGMDEFGEGRRSLLRSIFAFRILEDGSVVASLALKV